MNDLEEDGIGLLGGLAIGFLLFGVPLACYLFMQWVRSSL